jgi:hypothetical protein
MSRPFDQQRSSYSSLSDRHRLTVGKKTTAPEFVERFVPPRGSNYPAEPRETKTAHFSPVDRKLPPYDASDDRGLAWKAKVAIAKMPLGSIGEKGEDALALQFFKSFIDRELSSKEFKNAVKHAEHLDTIRKLLLGLDVFRGKVDDPSFDKKLNKLKKSAEEKARVIFECIKKGTEASARDFLSTKKALGSHRARERSDATYPPGGGVAFFEAVLSNVSSGVETSLFDPLYAEFMATEVSMRANREELVPLVQRHLIRRLKNEHCVSLWKNVLEKSSSVSERFDGLKNVSPFALKVATFHIFVHLLKHRTAEIFCLENPPSLEPVVTERIGARRGGKGHVKKTLKTLNEADEKKWFDFVDKMYLNSNRKGEDFAIFGGIKENLYISKAYSVENAPKTLTPQEREFLKAVVWIFSDTKGPRIQKESFSETFSNEMIDVMMAELNWFFMIAVEDLTEPVGATETQLLSFFKDKRTAVDAFISDVKNKINLPDRRARIRASFKTFFDSALSATTKGDEHHRDLEPGYRKLMSGIGDVVLDCVRDAATDTTSTIKHYSKLLNASLNAKLSKKDISNREAISDQFDAECSRFAERLKHYGTKSGFKGPVTEARHFGASLSHVAPGMLVGVMWHAYGQKLAYHHAGLDQNLSLTQILAKVRGKIPEFDFTIFTPYKSEAAEMLKKLENNGTDTGEMLKILHVKDEGGAQPTDLLSWFSDTKENKYQRVTANFIVVLRSAIKHLAKPKEERFVLSSEGSPTDLSPLEKVNLMHRLMKETPGSENLFGAILKSEKRGDSDVYYVSKESKGVLTDIIKVWNAKGADADSSSLSAFLNPSKTDVGTTTTTTTTTTKSPPIQKEEIASSRSLLEAVHPTGNSTDQCFPAQQWISYVQREKRVHDPGVLNSVLKSIASALSFLPESLGLDLLNPESGATVRGGLKDWLSWMTSFPTAERSSWKETIGSLLLQFGVTTGVYYSLYACLGIDANTADQIVGTCLMTMGTVFLSNTFYKLASVFWDVSVASKTPANEDDDEEETDLDIIRPETKSTKRIIESGKDASFYQAYAETMVQDLLGVREIMAEAASNDSAVREKLSDVFNNSLGWISKSFLDSTAKTYFLAGKISLYGAGAVQIVINSYLNYLLVSSASPSSSLVNEALAYFSGVSGLALAAVTSVGFLILLKNSPLHRKVEEKNRSLWSSLTKKSGYPFLRELLEGEPARTVGSYKGIVSLLPRVAEGFKSLVTQFSESEGTQLALVLGWSVWGFLSDNAAFRDETVSTFVSWIVYSRLSCVGSKIVEARTQEISLKGVSGFGIFVLHVFKAVVNAIFYYPAKLGMFLMVDAALATQAVSFFWRHNHQLREKVLKTSPREYSSAVAGLFAFVERNLPSDAGFDFDVDKLSLFNPVTWNASALVGAFLIFELFSLTWQHKLYVDQKRSATMAENIISKLRHETYFTSLGKPLYEKEKKRQ